MGAFLSPPTDSCATLVEPGPTKEVDSSTTLLALTILI